ncbi:MAG: NUDIX domain-containing protein [Chitinophagales bacterium]
MKYRITSRGILQHNNQILFVCYDMGGKQLYALPGGQQIMGETLAECVKREFQEETGLEVEVGNLVLVNEFIQESSDFVEDWKEGIHQVEHIFEVTLVSEEAIEGAGTNFDPGMIGIQWMDRETLPSVQFYPEREVAWFFGEKNGSEAFYRSKRY